MQMGMDSDSKHQYSGGNGKSITTELVRDNVLYLMEYDVSIPADSKDSADCENHQGDSLLQQGTFPACRLKKC